MTGCENAAVVDLVVLAAGMGRRFGGLKQLAAVGPGGEAIFDVVTARAADAGFTRAVVVVRREIEANVSAHLCAHPAPLPVELVLQEPVIGTAHAVLAARPTLRGGFAVVNADDCYPTEAFMQLGTHLRRPDDRAHALVAFRLRNTLLDARPVSRAFLDVDAAGRLGAVHEETVAATVDDPRGDLLVSMNMWGFRPSMLDVLADAIDAHTTTTSRAEVRLPDVVDAFVAAGGIVRVVPCEARCVGLTYAEDLPAVRAAIAAG